VENPSAVLPTRRAPRGEPVRGAPHPSSENPPAVLPTRRTPAPTWGRASAHGAAPGRSAARAQRNPSAVLPTRSADLPRRKVPDHVIAQLEEYKERARFLSAEEAAELKAELLGEHP
jgi:hypothetical protein